MPPPAGRCGARGETPPAPPLAAERVIDYQPSRRADEPDSPVSSGALELVIASPRDGDIVTTPGFVVTTALVRGGAAGLE
ncbi:MAG: hypothetical protein VXW43_19760, partial [Pseudomonadota bacterium]|nr:hypothetical protein [Pseudomonadota bacterium]